MADFWSFLLQTLTASGAAALLLAVKALFRDKLSPRWQFASWGILALVLLLPAGLGGRYTLVNWPLIVETCKSAATGDFGTLTHVTAPVPLLPSSRPASFFDWLFVLYAAGVIFFLARYAIAYIRLRAILRKGRPADCPQLQSAAEHYHLPVCRAVEVTGLPTAFICGVLRPVLALPAGVETDEKILLHELLHLKYRDVLWGVVICIFRCIHWCNPLLWYCAGLAGNDLESLCDQRVLERLEGEDRRDYGRILLSMADDKYARAPGTSSVSNGGKNIRRRIEVIVRFKRYPKGMALVSVCIVLLLTVPLLAGTKARALTPGGSLQADNAFIGMASARTVWCTTYAGAFDTYAKAVLCESVLYRAMCAPLSEQGELAALYRSSPHWTWEQIGLSVPLQSSAGYQIYNLTPLEGGAYEGVLVTELGAVPPGQIWDGTVKGRWMAAQKLRAEREGERWVIRPLEKIYEIQGDERAGGNLTLPAWKYSAEAGDFTLLGQVQRRCWVDSSVTNPNNLIPYPSFDPTPQPDGEFTDPDLCISLRAFYTGDPANKSRYRSISGSCHVFWGGCDYWGPHSISRELEENWEDPVWLLGLDVVGTFEGVPESFAVDLYLNGDLAAQLTLLPVEGDV